ncbi:MAG: hypothetical protein IT385_17740 [Deltaproteobacteria bacterium]|nr:hypothetical protein [Deltaproteobacteria bacterium]
MDGTLIGLALALTLAPRPGAVTFHTPDTGFPTSYPRALAIVGDDLWVSLGATGTPEGLARITSAESPGRVVRVFRHVGEAPADAPPDLVYDLEVDGADLLVATGRGLWRWRAGGAAFEQVVGGGAVPELARAPDGAVWAVVAVDDLTFTALPVDPARAGPDTRATRPTCRRPLLLAPRSATFATLVCEEGILDLGARGGLEVDLTGTPLRIEPTGSERGRPPVWIHDAATAADGALYLLSQRGGLVRRRDDHFVKVIDDGRERRILEERRRQELVPNTDLVDLLIEPGGGALVADVRGVVHRWTGEASEQVWPLKVTLGLHNDPADGGVRLVAATADGALWMVVERGDPHLVIRLGRGPLGPRATFWALRRPGTSYLDPGVLDSLSDGRGGLWLSTNDGLWHLRP